MPSVIAMQPAQEPIVSAEIERVVKEAEESRSHTLQVSYVGRLLWRRFLSELIEFARQECLEFSYEADPHVFSIGLTVTVCGGSSAVYRVRGLRRTPAVPLPSGVRVSSAAANARME